ncbi:hypothetical protein D3C73_648700 [compost metagenome]
MAGLPAAKQYSAETLLSLGTQEAPLMDPTRLPHRSSGCWGLKLSALRTMSEEPVFR